ncbi:MAG: NIPSNAP family protein [Bryobacterales bacterium]|nr:NIPSNAP family protein [Bryobacterales bacterium]
MNHAPAKLYSFEQYFLKNSSQSARLHAWVEEAWLPAYTRLTGSSSVLVADAIVADHVPQVALIAEWDSFAQWHETRASMRADADMRAALGYWEDHHEPPYEHFTQSLLEATPYSPTLQPGGEKSRIFELRVYHAPTYRQLRALHDRFEGPEIPIFHRCGIHPVLYTSALFGSWMPNLVYFTPFDNLAARETAWAKFMADEEWVRVRTESIAEHGQINAFFKVALYRASAYSPVK